jgi:hypothetical protein
MEWLTLALLLLAALVYGLGMLPMRAVRLQVGELLAADAATLAPAALANKIVLVANDLAIDENKVFADITAATFTGSTAIAGAVGTQLAGVDPATGEQIVTIKVPAGGYHWECTAAPATPETIFAFALCDNALTTLLALAPMPDGPVVVSAVGDIIDLGDVTMRVVFQPIS